MKKSSIAIAITALIVLLSGAIYIGKSYIAQNNKNGEASINDLESSEVSKQENEKVEFLEYKHILADNETVNVRYMKSGSTNRIYSLYPVNTESEYDISSNGSAAVYVSKDGQLWLFYNDGSKKVIVSDKYESFVKSDIQKKIKDYVWVEKPCFTQEGNIQFYSSLPNVSEGAKKSLWELSTDDSSMKKLYTPATSSFKQLGYGNSGRQMFIDGDNIAAVSSSDNIIEKIDIKDKQIFSLSPDGNIILFCKKDKNGQTDYKTMYAMDSQGKNISKLPAYDGYAATPIGSWYSDGTRYAFIIRSLSGNKDKVAVLITEEDSFALVTYDTGNGIKIPDTSKLNWSGDSSVSIDKGDDIVDVSLK